MERYTTSWGYLSQVNTPFWGELGLPPRNSSIGFPTSITYAPPQCIGCLQQIYVFGVGSTGHLVVAYGDGFNWYWADQGLPPGLAWISNPTAITYASGGQQRIYVFATANTGHLVVNCWDGFKWHWVDQGLPPSPAGVGAVNTPTAITYASGGIQLIYVFGSAFVPQTQSSPLVVNHWDGVNWHWANLGLPAFYSGVYLASAITYPSQGGSRSIQPIYVFAEGNAGDLVFYYWNGLSSSWSDQGTM
jgi:hypothetical protein